MKSLLVDLLILGAAAFLWRIAQYLSPSIGMTVVGISLFIALAVFYLKEVPPIRTTRKWAAFIFVGASLNFAAIIGNGGMMPYPHIMSSAWWVWLGDWIVGHISPGDILMVIGFCGVTASLVISQWSTGGKIQATGLTDETPQEQVPAGKEAR